MNTDLILRVGTKLVLPFVLLFALYVQFHGDYSPGGGFQAGVIASAGVFLVAITFGMRQAKLIAPPAVVQFMVPLGVLIFAGAGVVGLVIGRAFLDYSVLGPDPVRARELGILIAEFGVLVTVAGTITSLFYAFAERGRP
jgi:multicomponent Na+:H+ antiporter subunit B